VASGEAVHGWMIGNLYKIVSYHLTEEYPLLMYQIEGRTNFIQELYSNYRICI